ncbi:MAG: hypothetical protein JWL77_2250 [Chthonomonadaceae bacterium]|nr:hypothetical protein [Chthonomonadaceae bacterium]
MHSEQPWYSVKCVFRHDDLVQNLAASERVGAVPLGEGEIMYEERIVVFEANSLEEAITLGEAEAKEYAGSEGMVHFTGFISAYHLFDPEIKSGAEMYSLMRQSDLKTDAFLDHYYDDGTERTQRVEDTVEGTQK